MKLAQKIDPRTEASARALGYYSASAPETEADWKEHAARSQRLYFWFPAEALDEVPQTLDDMAHHQRHGRLRMLSLETRFLWALTVGQAETLRRAAEAYSAATRGLFRRNLARMGFYGPESVELALRAYLKGKRVDVNHSASGTNELRVDGRLVAVSQPGVAWMPPLRCAVCQKRIPDECNGQHVPL